MKTLLLAASAFAMFTAPAHAQLLGGVGQSVTGTLGGPPAGRPDQGRPGDHPLGQPLGQRFGPDRSGRLGLGRRDGRISRLSD